MKKNILSHEFYSDTISQDFIRVFESEIAHVDDTTIYYKFPIIRELNMDIYVPNFLVINPYYGVILIRCDSIIKSRNQTNILDIDNELSRIEELIFSRLIRSSNPKLKNGKRQLSFNLSSILYLPNYIDDINLDSTSNRIITNGNELKEYFASINDEKMEVDVLDEIFSIIDGSTAISIPKERKVTNSDLNSKACIIKKLEEEIAKFDDNQKYAAFSQLVGPQRIRGLAGSGKTVILCMKAALLHLKDPNLKILYTFTTRSLYDYIELLITRFYKALSDGQKPDFDNSILIKHAWGGDNLKGVYYETCIENDVASLTYEEAIKFTNRRDAFDYVCRNLLKCTNGNLKKVYDYVLIDEAQDFKPSFYQICREIVKNDCIVWGYDELQNIFDVQIQDTYNIFANEYGRDGINLSQLQSNYPEMDNDIVLYKCYRNPREILVMAHAIGFGIYNDRLIQTLENNSHWEDLGYTVLQGNCVNGDDMIIERERKNSPLTISDFQNPNQIIETFSAINFRAEIDWVCNMIEQSIFNEGLRPDDIAVISLDDINSKLYFAHISDILLSKGIYTNNLSLNSYRRGFYENNCVTLSTLYKAKGNEAAMVFVVGCDVAESHKDNRVMRNKIFTAFTRSKAWLKISGIDLENHSLYREINKVKENNFQLKFTYKEAHIIQRDLEEVNALKSKKRKAIEETIERLKSLGFSPEEIDDMLENIDNYRNASDKK